MYTTEKGREEKDKEEEKQVTCSMRRRDGPERPWIPDQFTHCYSFLYTNQR